jgi:hypothetical protein
LEFDPKEYLTTELGETYFNGEKAKVSKANIKPYGEINLELLYGPDDNVNSGYEYYNVLNIFEVKTGATQSTFYGITNKKTTAQVDFLFDLIIQDALFNTCTMNNIALTIPINDYYGSVVVDWCNPVAPAPPNLPLCINFATNVSITVGWIDQVVFANISDDSLC